MKKTSLKILLILFVLMTFTCTFVQASYSTVNMSVVDEPICKIKLGTNSYFEKSLISKDLNNKEVTIQLKVTNNEGAIKPSGEIMLVIDNSESMLDQVTPNVTREDAVINSAKSLVENLLKDNNNLKIGAVSFSTSVDMTKEATTEDAKLVSDLTNDSSKLLKAISDIDYDGPRTNLQAGLNLAKKYFTDSTDKSHKYIIVLSDGVPNVSIGNNNPYYSDTTIANTKTELQSLKSVSDNVIILLTGISNGDETPLGLTKSYNEIVREIFGTTDNPTIGKFYNIPDAEIEKTITDQIYNDLVETGISLTNIKITDYFPKDIVDNFNISYVKNANIGTISEKIDKTTNSITWNIPELKYGETAIVQYKLKLKENFDSKIVGLVLKTNEKVDLSYTDYNGKTVTQTSNVTPTLKLAEPVVNPSNQPYPKAGLTTIISLVGISLLIVTISGIKYIKINKD